MKKGLLVVFALLIVLVGSVYIFIPAQLDISRLVIVHANSVATFRCLADEAKWLAWWPGTVSTPAMPGEGAKDFQYNNTAYHINQASVNAVGIRISNNATQTQSVIQAIKYGADSTAIQWTCTLETGRNPFAKIAAYRNAVLLKSNMDAVLKKVQVFLSKPENVYGITINRAILKDSTLIATRYFSASYPDTETVYSLIARLRHYAAQQGAQETNYPMLHVEDRKEGQVETMIALPVNKMLAGNGSIFFKRLLVPTVLTTDVYGGPEKLKKANTEMMNYINDLHLFSPAISFESLITDRLAEHDTSKWITKIYLPVMQLKTR